MIRRGFWLAAGAVFGISGYRRATKLARTLTGQDRLVLTRQDRPALPGQVRGQRAAARGQRAAAAAAGRSAIAGVAATAGFVRDVREGMAEYRDLHSGDLDRRLTSQSGRAVPGESQQGHLEP